MAYYEGKQFSLSLIPTNDDFYANIGKMNRRKIRKALFYLFLKTITSERQKTEFILRYIINQKS